MTNSVTSNQISEIMAAIERGIRTLRKPEPLRLSEWAAENFYLSAESSYVEGAWEAFPYQIGIMDAISNDDILDVTFIKSARVGYTKIILAAMGYFAEHKRRNQAVWQPVDDDADEFVKTELDPMLRDVPAVRNVFPWYNTRSKYNTLRQKVFTGSTIHIRGGKAAKNYRRISVDVGYLDELDGFDRNIEMEGDARSLARKRLEGATFPKLIAGSTPKLKRDSQIAAAAEEADLFLRYHIPCQHCGEMIQLTWGGPDNNHGFKWINNDPDTVKHMCPSCASLFEQRDYLDIWHRGRWVADGGKWIDDDGHFRDKDGAFIDPPQSIAFHIWTAYSPQTTWAKIVREFLQAKRDPEKLKVFVNTTLGEPWEDDVGEQADHQILYRRREHYKAEVPDGVLAISFGVDTQDDRFEIQWDGWGVGEERWGLHYERLYGDPSRPEIWDRLADRLRRTFVKSDGTILNAVIGCHDFGGHYSDEVTAFSRRMGIRFLIPVRGANTYGKPVANFPRKRNAKGVYLTEVGTDTAKDLLYQRMEIMEPGPGYWHWPISDEFDELYFKQLTNEERITKQTEHGRRLVWVDKSRRQEPWDCSVYSLAAIRIAQQHFGLNFAKLAETDNGHYDRASLAELAKKLNK